MKGEILIPKDFERDLKQNSLNLKLTKIENRNTYNTDTSTHTTTYNQYNQNKGILGMLFELVSLPFKLIFKLIRGIFRKFMPKYKLYTINKNKLLARKKSLKKINSIHNFNNNEIL